MVWGRSRGAGSLAEARITGGAGNGPRMVREFTRLKGRGIGEAGVAKPGAPPTFQRPPAGPRMLACDLRRGMVWRLRPL